MQKHICEYKITGKLIIPDFLEKKFNGNVPICGEISLESSKENNQ